MQQEKKGPVTLLKEQFEEKSSSCKSLQEEYLRAIADFDNLRKRNERDILVSRRLALEALVVDLLPVLDNFERAVQVARSGATADGLQKGMDLIHKQLRETICRHGVEEYSCLGSPFDPRRAEAVSFVHTDEHKPGTVVSEVSKGYAAGDRVLRPARVVVAKEIESSQKSETRNQDSEVAEGAGRESVAESENSKDGAGDSGSVPNG